MKRSRKISLIIVAVALLACVGVVILRRNQPNEPIAVDVTETSGGPSFEVRVVVPRLARPLGGILPDWVVSRMDGTPSELRFDHASPGARIGGVGHNRLELSADGWDLSIGTDDEGRITPGTRLVFQLALGGKLVRLRCRPADRANGYLRTATRPGADDLNGSFLVELATCENADSGKAINWPPSPLTLGGNFVGLPPRNPSLEKPTP